ncbi:MAG TPA: NADPH:quinone reductase [Hyphomicrobiaceae bacterium]|nr:NADPH:quinone reductase [Hyphomicrobiaceae bacterium]
MKAAWFERRGPARDVLRIGEMEDPEPGPGEVRVAIAVSGVNPSDVKGRGIRRGNAQMAFPRIIPHQDGAGVIDKVGTGVAQSRVGERVWLYMSQYGRPFGTAAEYVVVPVERAVRLPAAADFSVGASLGVPAMTAHYALFSDGPVSGKSVLVHGAAGAVGFYAVQLAKWGGARHVVATVSRKEQAAQAMLAGADAVIDYKRENVAERILSAAETRAGVERIIDVSFGANIAVDAAVIARGGTIAAYGSDAVPEPVLPFHAFSQKDARLRMVLIYQAPQSARETAAREISALLEVNALKHRVAGRFRLDEIAAAHEAVEAGGGHGKVLVDVASS